MKEIKFEFVFQHPNSNEVMISRSYSLDEILETNIEEIENDCCNCDCQPTGETNVIECNCIDYYQDFKLIHKRQFTGLLDKNKKEIYDGDIVEFYYKGEFVICIIVWNIIGCWSLKWSKSYINNYFLNPSNYVVIGNIYQNMDLLKK